MRINKAGRNHTPYFQYKEVDLNVTATRLDVIFQTRDNLDYLLQNVYAQWPAVGDASPSAFADIRFKLEFPQFGRQLIDNVDPDIQSVPVAMNIITSPGPYNNFSGGVNQPNQMFFKSARIDQPLKPKMTFVLQISNFLGAANPGVIDILIVGRNVHQQIRQV